MKGQIITLFAIAMLLAACNQAANKDAKNQEVMHHQEDKNVMMQAMDDSMMAMHNMKQTGNPDYDFAAMMIPHHEGAVIMAKELIKKGKSDSLISFAKQVITAQEIEIKQLQELLKSVSQVPSKDAASVKLALANSMKPMMNGMENIKLTGDTELDFVSLMIPHHQSAVAMAKAYLPFATNDQIKNMAIAIVSAQEKEIIWLKQF